MPEAGFEAGRPLEASFAIRVREGSGRPVERTIKRLVMPPQPVLGIKPLFADGAVPEGAEAGFALLALGPDLGPVAMPVRW